jgi:2-amino-4-hydroxy-6-hydroxymethyldihydropteridine diphosphokinase
MSTRRRAYLGLGSNLGDRLHLLQEAVARLDHLPDTRVIACSSVHETPPWGYAEQPVYLNMAVILETTLSPEALLTATREIESALGRQRTLRWGPRTIDIDLLVVEGETRNTPELQLPHPHITERRFVLEPLAEIAPDLLIHGRTVRAWLAALSNEPPDA